jgi:hypothetical protein
MCVALRDAAVFSNSVEIISQKADFISSSKHDDSTSGVMLVIGVTASAQAHDRTSAVEGCQPSPRQMHQEERMGGGRGSVHLLRASTLDVFQGE